MRIVEGQHALGVALAALLRHGDAAPAGQELPGERVFGEADFLRRPLGHDFAAMHAGTGTHVHHVVGCADGVLVMLDHQDRVADIA